MTALAKDESLCIGCGACERACSQAYFKVEDREKSCVRVDPASGGTGFSLTICTQCGICARECPTMALRADARGVIRLNKDTCVNCYICVGYCPTGAMMRRDDRLEPFKCVACGLCVKACPTKALTLVKREG